MKKFIGLIFVALLAGCSICKSSDSPEVCRTKQRDHSHPRAEVESQPALLSNGLRWSAMAFWNAARVSQRP